MNIKLWSVLLLLCCNEDDLINNGEVFMSGIIEIEWYQSITNDISPYNGVCIVIPNYEAIL